MEMYGEADPNVQVDSTRDAAVALFNYLANNHPPFPPDPRMELSLHPGLKLEICSDDRDDGWIIARKPGSKKEYFVPGNYVSYDGVQPIWQKR
eukprot:CAMPEP_0181317426 /NCGR_PEP_ID=MMETSP1101-20121128/16461_1 /TAXON_ID=46948 /ORGANISM="Rhodomonas abbreviata, Strain Caron Lab Isolate" /LENGTH=92 /DNA_ID=CAMNT_0023424817 /DNA_START=320 /DNA_END=598 /DNA_ORIENTATION=-